MEKRYQVIKPAHGYYKGECLDTDIAPTIDTGVGCWHTLIGESMEEIKCEQVGQIVGSGFTEMTGRIYSENGLSPSIRTFAGGNTEVKILEPIIYDDYNGRIRADQDCIGTLTTNCGNDALRNGVKIIEPRVMVVGNYSPSGHNASSIVDTKGIAPTVMENHGTVTAITEPVIVDEIYNNREPRVYREHCPTIRAERQGFEVIEPTAYDEQNGYLRQDGCVGTLTTDGSSPKHNNRIVEPNFEQEELDMGIIYELSKTYRIRKLTPNECGRLMGVKLKDCEQLAKNQSTSSQYHLYGDSIATTCLMAIFGELFKVDYKTKINELVEELKQ